jgi:hypothetical protein
VTWDGLKEGLAPSKLQAFAAKDIGQIVLRRNLLAKPDESMKADD